MSRTILLDDANPEIASDLAMALDRTSSAVEMSSGEPDDRRRNWTVWQEANLRVHHADYANSLLVGLDSVARQHLRDRSPRSKLPGDVDMHSAWRLRDISQIPDKRDFSTTRALASTRAWLGRTHEAVSSAAASPQNLSTHALTAYCGTIAQVYASFLLGERSLLWLIMFEMLPEGLSVCADAAGGTSTSSWIRFSPIPRGMLPKPVAAVTKPLTLRIDGGARKIDLSNWQTSVKTDCCTGDPISVARALRAEDTAAVAQMILAGDLL